MSVNERLRRRLRLVEERAEQCRWRENASHRGADAGIGRIAARRIITERRSAAFRGLHDLRRLGVVTTSYPRFPGDFSGSFIGIASNPERAAVYFQEQPYITEWFTEEQVAAVCRAARMRPSPWNTAAAVARGLFCAFPSAAAFSYTASASWH